MVINSKKTIAIVPVFNEENTIKSVLDTLERSYLIDEIIVVNDASTDNTLRIIRNMNSEKIRVLSLDENVGKSRAIQFAVKDLDADILFFCDGDLHNFSEEHIEQILAPFATSEVAMSVGLRDYHPAVNLFSKTVFPLITGERAVSYPQFGNVICDTLMKGYDIEPVLNHYCRKHKIPVYKNILTGVRQTNKPIKRKHGTFLLMKQSIEIMRIIVLLKIRK